MEFSFNGLSQWLDKLFAFFLDVNATVIDQLLVNGLIVGF